MEIRFKANTHKEILYTISGKLLCIDVIKLTKMLENLLNSVYEQIIVDLQEVEYIDSGSIGGLIYLKQLFLKNKKNLSLSVPRDKRKMLFRECYSEEIFNFIDPREEENMGQEYTQ